MGGGRLHWCLENDESARENKTIDGSLVLRLKEDVYCGERFLDNPNARLIAASPKLLEACEVALFFIEQNAIATAADALRAAINNLKGESA
jgi:hypothetical protein